VITLTFFDSPGARGRKFTFKTIAGAQRKAINLVGESPRLDPDGYAVHPKNGNCLYFSGVTASELWGP
jgi:hypothetical protein